MIIKNYVKNNLHHKNWNKHFNKTLRFCMLTVNAIANMK